MSHFDLADSFLRYVHSVPPTLTNLEDKDKIQIENFSYSANNKYNTEDNSQEYNTETECSSQDNTVRASSSHGNQFKWHKLNCKEPCMPTCVSEPLANKIK